MQVHDLRAEGLSAGEIYDRTQCDEAFKDGDVIVGAQAVVILVEAWPVLVKGDTGGAFHTLEDGASFETLDNGKYAEAYKKAMEIEL